MEHDFTTKHQLLIFPMRGHRHPQNPYTMSAEQFLYECRHRAYPTQQKRWCDERLAAEINFVVRRICAKRHIPCIEVFSAPSCTFVRVQWPENSFQSSLVDAINVATTRRARREVRWPLDERVFAKHPSVLTLAPQHQGITLRDLHRNWSLF